MGLCHLIVGIMTLIAASGMVDSVLNSFSLVIRLPFLSAPLATHYRLPPTSRVTSYLIAGGDLDSRYRIRTLPVARPSDVSKSASQSKMATMTRAAAISGMRLSSSASCVWYVPSDLIAYPWVGLDVPFVSYLWLHIRSIDTQGAFSSSSGLRNLLQIG